MRQLTLSWYDMMRMYRDTNLKSLDFIPVTPKDRQMALVWSSNYRAKPKPKPSDDDMDEPPR